MFEEEIVNGYNISIFRVSKLNGGITMKFYICPESQTVVEVVAGLPAPLTCDGKPMEELVPNSTNAAVEKHMPVLSAENGVLKVCVGEVEHPSIEKHWIPFVAVKAGDLVLRRSINATEKPEAIFPLGDFKGEVEVYAWCNLHGIWKATITL